MGAVGREETLWVYKFKDEMTSGFAKLEKRIDILEKKMGGFETKSERAFSRANKSATKFQSTNSKLFEGLQSESAFLSRMGPMISNPYVLAGAAAVGLGAILFDSTKKAEAFNNQMLELRNLNLDKTSTQMDALSDMILNTSIEKGLNPVKTSKAFFDIQSATGKYGKEVENIVGRVGQFSQATKADMDEMTNAVAKAMNAYRFGDKQIDKFLESQAKTVQVGITTFDQLAKVQTEYASAAVGAGQGFDTANKFFAAFSKSSKSVDIAATMTKTAFQGLSDPNVQKGLMKYKINLFDANGQMLDATKIATQMNDTISQMSDQKFSKFMGDVGGPEGMRGLLQMMKASGDDIVKSFSDFDNTKFSIDAALKNAKGDPAVMKEIVKNQMEGIQTQIGSMFLPAEAKGLNWFSDQLSGIKDTFGDVNKENTTAKNTFDGLMKGGKLLFDIFTLPYNISLKIYGTIGKWAVKSELVKKIAEGTGKIFSGMGTAIEKMLEGISWFLDNTLLRGLNAAEDIYLRITGRKQLMETVKNQQIQRDVARGFLGADNYAKLEDPRILQGISKMYGINSNADALKLFNKESEAANVRTAIADFDILSKLDDTKTMKRIGKIFGIKDKFGAVGILQGKRADEFRAAFDPEAAKKGGAGAALGGTIDDINGGGKSVKYLTINISKLVESVNNYVSDVKEGMKNSEQIVAEALMKVVRDAELSI